MTERQRNLLYREALNSILNIKDGELTKINNIINLGTCATIGFFSTAGMISVLDPSIDMTIPFALGGISLLTSVIFYIKKIRLVKTICEDAWGMIDSPEILNNKINDLAKYLRENGVDINAIDFLFTAWYIKAYHSNKEDEQSPEALVAYTTSALEERCNMLMNYANEVAYPGYKNDLNTLSNIIEGLQYRSSEDLSMYSDAINVLEVTMQRKAYNFYTQGFTRQKA